MFLPKQKKDTKEFMKYEDGKIVSIEVEQKPKPKIIEDMYEEEKEENTLKERGQTFVKQHVTMNRLKTVGIVIVCLLFIFALYDTYKVFFVTDSGGTDNPNPSSNHPVATKPMDQDTKKPNSEKTDTTKPVEKPVDSTTGGTVQSKPVEPTGDSSIKQLLSITNSVNSSMVSIVSNELSYIEAYENKQSNRVALLNRLKKSQKEKEELYIALESRKSLFEKENMMSFYVATENRLVQSILFSKQLQTSMDTGKEAIPGLIQAYIAQDDVTRKTQQDELIKILQTNNIPYTVNEQRNQVEFTLN